MLDADRAALQQSRLSEASLPLSQRSMLRELFTPVIMLYTLAYFCLTNTLSALSVWTPLILRSFNEQSSNITIGILSAIPQICTIVGMIWWSKRSDRLKERKLHTLLPYLFAAAGWMLTASSSNPLLQFTGIVMASAGAFAAMVIFWTTPDQSISLRARAGDCGDQRDRHDRRGAGAAVDGLAERRHGEFQRRYLYGRRVPGAGRGGDCRDSDENGGETKHSVSADRLIFLPIRHQGRQSAALILPAGPCAPRYCHATYTQSTFIASPPREVSRYLSFISLPVSYIVSITLSSETCGSEVRRAPYAPH